MGNITKEPCGISFIKKLRIVGGTEATPHSQPWVVSLKEKVQDGPTVISYTCGGVLISRWHVLSASHCNNVCCWHTFSFAILGEHDLSEADGEKKHEIKKWHEHPKARWLTMSGPVLYDYAIAELKNVVEYTDYIQPICLPLEDHLTYSGDIAIVSGWGRVKFNGSLSNKLMTTNVTILHTSECKAEWDKLYKNLNYIKEVDYPTNVFMCAADPEKYEKDVCKGDSGGRY